MFFMRSMSCFDCLLIRAFSILRFLFLLLVFVLISELISFSYLLSG
jgi:hypothetical protein